MHHSVLYFSGKLTMPDWNVSNQNMVPMETETKQLVTITKVSIQINQKNVNILL